MPPAIEIQVRVHPATEQGDDFTRTLRKTVTSTFSSKADPSAPTEIKAFLATPKTAGKHGGVLVVHEIFGLTDHIKDVACRLAQAGFNALAPDLFTREGAPPPLSGGSSR